MYSVQTTSVSMTLVMTGKKLFITSMELLMTLRNKKYDLEGPFFDTEIR